jgi:hypothetical protein
MDGASTKLVLRNGSLSNVYEILDSGWYNGSKQAGKGRRGI